MLKKKISKTDRSVGPATALEEALMGGNKSEGGLKAWKQTH